MSTRVLVYLSQHTSVAWNMNCWKRASKSRDKKFFPAKYGGVLRRSGYRTDLFGENFVVVELKAVDKLDPIHRGAATIVPATIRIPIGLLLNFNVTELRRGIRRLVNNFREKLPRRSLR